MFKIGVFLLGVQFIVFSIIAKSRRKVKDVETCRLTILYSMICLKTKLEFPTKQITDTKRYISIIPALINMSFNWSISKIYSQTKS